MYVSEIILESNMHGLWISQIDRLTPWAALPADPESYWPGRQGLVAAGLSVSEPLLAGVEPSAADQATIITISRPPSLKVKLLI